MPRPQHGKRVSVALLRMKHGETLHAQVTGEGVAYWLEPSGRSVGPVTAGRLLGLPCIRPENDTLFGTVSQTYRYVEPK